jgi:hypothetical protein
MAAMRIAERMSIPGSGGANDQVIDDRPRRVNRPGADLVDPIAQIKVGIAGIPGSLRC